MTAPTQSLRRDALQKLALLSARATTDFESSDLSRLCKACSDLKRHGPNLQDGSFLERQPMALAEFEVLLALCKAAPQLRTYDSAAKLAYQLSPYVIEAHAQAFVPSPFFLIGDASPAEALSFHLTSALLNLGINHPSLHRTIASKLWSYLDNCMEAAESLANRLDLNDRSCAQPSLEDATNVARLSISMLGFLDAAATFANFWTPIERSNVIQRIRTVLSGPFLIAVETSFSAVRNSRSTESTIKEWKVYYRQYAGKGRPLGAMLLRLSFMKLLVASSSLLVVDINLLRGKNILDILMSRTEFTPPDEILPSMLEFIAEIAAEEMSLLEDGADYVRMGSAWQQKLASSVKAAALISYLNCAFLTEDAVDPEVLSTWLEACLVDPAQMADQLFASVVLRCMAVLARISPDMAPAVIRLLPRFLVQCNPCEPTLVIAAKSLAFVLQMVSQDAIISTLYSLGNVLSSTTSADRAFGGSLAADLLDANSSLGTYDLKSSTGSAISLKISTDEETSLVYANVIKSMCIIARILGDEKITALAQSMLLQKINKVNQSVDVSIIKEVASLSLSGAALDFKSLLKLYGKMTENAVATNNAAILSGLKVARNYISCNISRDSAMYGVYLENLLQFIVSKGDVHHSHSTMQSDLEASAREIAQLLQPLALFMSTHNLAEDRAIDDDIAALIRDAWFNMVVHGFTINADRGSSSINELRVIAIHSQPLVSEQRGEQQESDIELNTILRRGGSSETEALQKKRLLELLPAQAAADIRGLSYRKVIFLQAVYLVETLRADAGDCSKALSYFVEPAMRTGDMSRAMEAVMGVVMDTYVRKALLGTQATFSAPYVARQLVSIFCGCCHRVERVQHAAIQCADHIIQAIPSALCQRSSIFALLELLSLLWQSCLEAETDEYAWNSSFTSSRGQVTIQLSDNFERRKRTLSTFHTRAKMWMSTVIDIAALDVKGLLQAYLSEHDDNGEYGHISLGRSFASELGAMFPSTDQKLVAIEQFSDVRINSASDFIAQYTTRQEYKFADPSVDHAATKWNLVAGDFRLRTDTAQRSPGLQKSTLSALKGLETRVMQKHLVPIGELRDVLRRAAALLCRSKSDESAITHLLVSIPFSIFSKQSIMLGVSLWLGVLNENPRMESRLLAEIVNEWERTIHKKLGIFHDKFSLPDPFFVKEEFAPSDREALSRQAQAAHNLLAPHSRLLQFFDSHFNATRLGSIDVQRIFTRLLRETLHGLGHSTGHPLARELRLQIVLFGLEIYSYSTTLTRKAGWHLKDKILSAALGWFASPPCWSFGGNRLQVKAEVRLLQELKDALLRPQESDETTPYYYIKEELLHDLISHEQYRLEVWLSPLARLPPQQDVLRTDKRSSEMVGGQHLEIAWRLNPSIAIFLASRLSSVRLDVEIRRLLLRYPEEAIHNPEALSLLLAGSLPADVNSQLKYLLYWAPVNPITAVTYFLPAYENHPFIVQYAMRALEHHPVDVTFFYVPQIVQTLRYDVLGYVERYIVETAKFSQLFAHQIIWNMKANSFKDDYSQIPDAIKPTLDKVLERMIAGLSPADNEFYEKEFRFFDEVTGISGKLKPFIKRSKPEKKQKIEEELRNIKVEVGVYLPSNPDGVVIGIDRKSGKPLQSHAKAPYMATFRIRKNLTGLDSMDDMLEEANDMGMTSTKDNTVEVWQSAIFKVGDDCRQDVLALQMIAAFRGIFNSVGLDVYVFPYRVTATAPGCGVIDVLPNSISRDMLGREAVNGLYEYFISKYGNEDSIRFQEARNNFVKSMAAYSVISYLLQFKDRHNGNIMLDDAGHILHIDFGFCFDIAPGGVKFERAPFKLTTEMVSVMGGNTEHQSYKWFEELCIKSFLASRQYVEKLAQIVLLMMDSGLPCFKPQTIQNFNDRFVLEKTDREAADYMKGLIRKSHSSYSTTVYDEFQRQTNAIPY